MSGVEWRNRIVGTGTEDPQQLLANPLNFRRHPREQQEAMSAILREVGWVSGIMVNKTTGHVIDGHLRVEQAIREGATEVPVTYVELSEREEAKILAVYDPLTEMAFVDNVQLGELLGGVSFDETALRGLAERLSAPSESTATVDGKDEMSDDDRNNPYSQNVETPIYTPRMEVPPPLPSLYDTTKRDDLLAQISAADVDDDVKAFLRDAADRHVVFNYQRIAEYYAHAPAAVQDLMERSALVIIDIDKAIEYGYVKARERVLKVVYGHRD